MEHWLRHLHPGQKPAVSPLAQAYPKCRDCARLHQKCNPRKYHQALPAMLPWFQKTKPAHDNLKRNEQLNCPSLQFYLGLFYHYLGSQLREGIRREIVKELFVFCCIPYFYLIQCAHQNNVFSQACPIF